MINIPTPENFDTECLLKGVSILINYYPNLHFYSEGGGEYYLHWTDSKEISEEDKKELKEYGWVFEKVGEDESNIYAWKYSIGWWFGTDY